MGGGGGTESTGGQVHAAVLRETQMVRQIVRVLASVISESSGFTKAEILQSPILVAFATAYQKLVTLWLANKLYLSGLPLAIGKVSQILSESYQTGAAEDVLEKIKKQMKLHASENKMFQRPAARPFQKKPLFRPFKGFQRQQPDFNTRRNFPPQGVIARCYVCGKPGHRAAQCRSKRTTHNRVPSEQPKTTA